MAEDAVVSLAGELIKICGSLAVQKVAIYWGVKDQLLKLQDTVTRIKPVLLDAEEQAQKQNNRVKVWLGELRGVVFDAEDLLNDFSIELQRKQLMPGGRVSKEVRIFFSRSNQFLYGWRMGHKIKELRENLDDIVAESEKAHHEERASITLFGEQTTSFEPKVIIGREDDKEEVKSFLLNSDNENTVSVISIVGMGGLGKTTLAQLVFNDEQVKSHFSPKHWVNVSGGLDVKKIIKDMLEAVGGDRDSNQLQVLKNRLKEKIRDRKFLFVLDDVWGDMNGQAGETWDSLKQLLTCGFNGSKIIITTSSKQIADFTSTESHVLKGLSNDDSWKLFEDRAFHRAEGLSEADNEKIKEEIVKRCCGVPLVIKAIARLMYQKDRDQWLSFVINELPTRVQDDNIINTLRLSYDPLPSHMKHCFAYCRLFSKGQRIVVKSLIQLWIAQGFISPSNPNECLEVAGLKCFRELLWRSFFHDAEDDGFGNIESCKMHDFMRDLATKVSGSESIKVDREGTTVSDSTRHVSFDLELDLSQQIPISSVSAKSLRTLMLLRGGQNKWNDKAWESICRDSRYLRVLDLHDLGMTEVSPLIKKLKHLKYLDLSRNKMETLPNSFTDLLNLQVLKLSGCRKLKTLPGDVNKMINLRHIDVGSLIEGNFCESLDNMPCGVGQLTSLQTLSCFIVGVKDSSKSKHIGGLDELKRLNELRGQLEIRIMGYERNSCISEFKEAKLSEKQYLQTLAINWQVSNGANCSGESRDDNHEGRPQKRAEGRIDVDADLHDEMLQSLQPHSNLQWFSLFGYEGMRLPSWLSYLIHLKKMDVVGCERCKYIPPLDRIPSLEELQLEDFSDLEYIDSEGVRREVSTFFPSLKKLKILGCPKLKGWWKKGRSDDNEDESSIRTPAVEEGEDDVMLYYFPCLSYLKIGDCPNLTSMPLFPSLDGELELWNSSSVPLQQTMKMKASSAWKSSVPPFSSSSFSFNQPPLSKLKKLRMDRIEDMESLPGLKNLSSLQWLIIEDCPRLKSMPLSQETHPCLEKLQICRCQELRLVYSRVGEETGVDLSTVDYVPNIQIDLQFIRRDGKWEYIPISPCIIL